MLELLRRRGQYSEESFDAMGLLQTLCLVKMDSVDGSKAARKQEPVQTSAAESPRSSTVTSTGTAENSCIGPNPAGDNKMETELKGKHRDT